MTLCKHRLVAGAYLGQSQSRKIMALRKEENLSGIKYYIRGSIFVSLYLMSG